MKNINKFLVLMFVCCVVSTPSYADILANNRFQKELRGEPVPDAPKLLPNSEKSLGSPVNSEGNPVKEFFDDPNNGLNSGSKSGAGKNSDSNGGGLNSGNDGSNGANAWGKGSKLNSDGSAAQNSGEDSGLNSGNDGSNGANAWGKGSKLNSDGSAAQNSGEDSGLNSSNDGSNGANAWGKGSKLNSDGSAAQNSGNGSGLNSDGSSDYNQNFPPLTETDKNMIPNASPPGMPKMPSKCAENSDCMPCYAEASKALNKQRMNLEKVSAIYNYTHRFTSEGLDMMNGVAAAAGGPAQMGAAVETQKVNGALDEFDKSVRNKNIELLGKLQEGLQQMAVCEAKYFENGDWYMRYGEVYYQFMQARYSN